MLSGLPQLDSTKYSSQVFWLFVSFSLLYFIVSKYFIPKIESIFFKRYNAIKGLISRADELCTLTEQKIKEQSVKLQDVRSQAKKMVHASILEAEKMNHNAHIVMNNFNSSCKDLINISLSELRDEIEQELVNITINVSKMYYRKMFQYDISEDDFNHLKNIVYDIYGDKSLLKIKI